MNAATEEPAENCAGGAMKIAAESAAGISCGRPVYPRANRHSVLAAVERTITSPSPTTLSRPRRVWPMTVTRRPQALSVSL